MDAPNACSTCKVSGSLIATKNPQASPYVLNAMSTLGPLPPGIDPRVFRPFIRDKPVLGVSSEDAWLRPSLFDYTRSPKAQHVLLNRPNVLR